MYETIVSQCHALSRFDNSRGATGLHDPYEHAIYRAQVFWYAYTHEGTTNGLRGGRLVLKEDDLQEFERTLPPRLLDNSATSPASTITAQTTAETHDQLQSKYAALYQLAAHYAELTLPVSRVCRKIHAYLTGPQARRIGADQSRPFPSEAVVSIWTNLDKCWDRFEVARQSGLWNGGVDSACPDEDLDVLISRWEIYLFECREC